MAHPSFAFGVMAAGAAFVVNLTSPATFDEAGATAAALIGLTAAQPALVQDAPFDRTASFSPGAILLNQNAAEPKRPLEGYSRRLAALETSARSAPANAVVLSPWRSAVRIEREQKPMERHELVSQIQRELARVGCYGGDIDGIWGGASKRAVSTFVDRVNATLPTTNPDIVLLTLARAQPAGTCGPDCPAGQEFHSDGRCVPSALLAQSSKRSRDDSVVEIAEARRGETYVVASAGYAFPAERRAAPLPGAMFAGATEVSARPGTPVTSVDGWAASASLTSHGGIPDGAEDDREATAASILPTSAVLSDRALAVPLATASTQRATSAPPSKRRAKTIASVSERPNRDWARRNVGYRAVKHLFENPLGRL